MRLSSNRTTSFFRVARPLLFAVVFGAVFLGCKAPDFVSNRYDNFTAYYNTFYNAKQVFEKGYTNLTRSTEPIDRVRFLAIYPRTSGSGTREFDSAVLKSADLLRKHPDSKWVDDALLLIGKSYFYQENFVGATQKFREVIDLNTALADEAVFWLARSLITSGSLDQAEKDLLFALARENVDKKWAGQYGLLLAELKVKLSSWQEASDYLTSSIAEVKDKTAAGRAQFLLGQVLEQQGRYEEAVEAYRKVNDFRPIYELSYAAKYSAVRVEGRHLDADNALAELRKMERDDKNFSNLAELQLLKARIWQEIGRDQEAFDIYDGLLYDPNPIGNAAQLKGRIHYAMGELYRDVDRNYVMAAAHFDSAAAALSTSSNTRSRIRSTSYSATQVQYAPEAITDANQLKTSYLKFATVHKELARYDSLLWLGNMDEEEFNAKVLDIRRQKAVEIAERKRLLEERQREQAFQTGIEVSDPFSTRGLPPGKIIPGLNDTDGSVDGFLFHKNPIRVQEGRATFEDTWGRRVLAPNWRRSAVLSSASSQQQVEDTSEELTAGEDLGAGELPEIDTSDVPRDSTAQVEMKVLRAISRYEMGNTLFLAMSMPDSAAVWYRTVIEEDAEQPVAQRALYALAEVQRALGDSNAAERLYRDILERFPDSDFSSDVRKRLGLDPVEAVISDSTTLSLMAYEQASEFAKTAAYDEAINRYFEVASDWLKYDESGKALFAAAHVFMSWADADSAKIFSEIPVTASTDHMKKLWPSKFSWVEADSVLVVPDVVVPDVLPPPADSTDISDAVIAPDSTMTEAILEPGLEPDSTEASPETVLPAADLPDAAQPPANLPPVAVPEAAPVDQNDAATTDPMAPRYEYVEAHEKRAPLYVEDIYVKLASEYRGRALGITAERTRKGIVERRTPPPDTTKVKADSLLMAANDRMISEMMADSLSEQDNILDLRGLLMGDSTAVALPDTLVAADSTAKPPGREVPVARSPGVMPNLAFNTEDLDDEEDRPSGARTSSNLRPLLPTGRPNLDAVGWTVILSTFPAMEPAKSELQNQMTRLGAAGIPLYIITNAEGEQLEFIVGWGLFETKALADEAIVKYEAFLPPIRNHLHLIPSTPRIP